MCHAEVVENRLHSRLMDKKNTANSEDKMLTTIREDTNQRERKQICSADNDVDVPE